MADTAAILAEEARNESDTDEANAGSLNAIAFALIDIAGELAAIRETIQEGQRG